MKKLLIVIKQSDGKKVSLRLDTDCSLAEIRNILQQQSFISENEYFLYDEVKVSRDSEEETKLEEILKDDKYLYIDYGKDTGIKTDSSVEDFREMTESQKTDMFEKCQVFRGISISEKGIERSSEQLFSWTKMPTMTNPWTNTQELSYSSFSKVTQEINLLTNDKTGLSLGSEFMDASAEYEHEKKTTSESSKTKTYLLEKYLVSKGIFEVDSDCLKPNEEFVRAVGDAMQTAGTEKDKICSLLHVLNKWGYFVPVKFSMGGMLYSVEETEITDFKQSESEKRAFSASAQAKMEGISAKTDNSHTEQTGHSESISEKYINTVINQVGGAPGKTKNKEGLAASLNLARYWELIDIERFYPSLLLLKNVKAAGTDGSLLASCLKLLDNQYYIGAVKQIQPYIDMYHYATDIETELDPF